MSTRNGVGCLSLFYFPPQFTNELAEGGKRRRQSTDASESEHDEEATAPMDGPAAGEVDETETEAQVVTAVRTDLSTGENCLTEGSVR